MKLSEHIAQCQELMAEAGDVEVAVHSRMPHYFIAATVRLQGVVTAEKFHARQMWRAYPSGGTKKIVVIS